MTQTPWVELKNFKPAPFALELLQTLEAAGYENTILRGGALRDMYCGREDKINDWDVCAHFGAFIPHGNNDKEIAAHYLRDLQDKLPAASDFKLVALDHIPELFLGVEFILQGKRIAMTTDGRAEPFPLIALSSDAPLNAIGMNTQGRVIAHPLFEEHAQRQIYAPFTGVNGDTISSRFTHLAGKFPGLQKGEPVMRQTEEILECVQQTTKLAL